MQDWFGFLQFIEEELLAPYNLSTKPASSIAKLVKELNEQGSFILSVSNHNICLLNHTLFPSTS